MLNLKTALLAALIATTVWFIWAWWSLSQKSKPNVPGEKAQTWYHSIVAFVMCFFDTLGIGNFATTTAAFKFKHSIPDEKIPGTLNIGYALPTVAQALIYMTIVQVDVWTLVLMIVASVLGAWLGAGVVAKWPRRNIQLGMGVCLIGAAILMAMTAMKIAPGAGESLSLEGVRLGLGLAGNFALGALMTLGIGLYGPCLILVSLLGMNPTAAFPIMMGSCAFLMPISSFAFVRSERIDLRIVLGIALGGIPAVLLAAFVVKSLDLVTLRWLVVVVVLYAAALLLRAAIVGEGKATPAASAGGAA